MRQSSGSNSSDQKHASGVIQSSQAARSHIQTFIDKKIAELEDIMSIQDPAKLHGMILSQKQEQQKSIIIQNSQLLQKNKILQQQIKKLRINQSSSSFSNNIENRIDIEQCREQSPVKQLTGRLEAAGFQNSKQYLRQIDQMHHGARQQQKNSQQQIIVLYDNVAKLMSKVSRWVQLNKLQMKVQKQQDYPGAKLLVSREKYDKLIWFYCNNFTIPTIQSTNKANNSKAFKWSNQGRAIDFDTNETQQDMKQSRNPDLQMTVEQLQSLFQNLAAKAGLNNEWKSYIARNKEQSVKFRTQMEAIANSKEDSQAKIKIQRNKKIINESILSSSQKDQEPTTTSMRVVNAQNQIQDILFDKISKFLLKLPISPKQHQLYNQFDKKRKSSRLYNVDEFLHQFQNKQDVHQLTLEYSNYLIKTLNLLVMRFMQTLSPNPEQRQQNSNENEQFKWLRKRLNQECSKIGGVIHRQLYKQSTRYVEDKFKNKKSKQITTPKFDKDRQLQTQLIQVVEIYRQIIQESIFDCNRRIEIRFR